MGKNRRSSQPEKRRRDAERKRNARKVARAEVSKAANSGVNQTRFHSLQRQESPKRSISSTIIGIVLTVLGLVFTYFQVRPDLSIEPDASLRRGEPLSMQFRVQNIGYFPAYDLHFGCEFSMERLRGVLTRDNSGQEPVTRLGSKESATRNCSVVGRSASGASLIVEVTYRRFAQFWPVSIKRERFAVQPDEHGDMHWFHQPLS